MRTTGLSRQIVLTMSVVTLGIVLMVLVGSTVFYGIMLELNPTLINTVTDVWLPSYQEWIWIGFTTLTALLIAVIAAIRLAKRILAPLNSVVEGVRRVAQGDLTARAVAGDRSLGETALLVDDFNALAERLQRMEQEFATSSAAIAHELRTPVTVLRGSLQGLAEGVFEPDERLFRSLLQQVEGLSRIIDDLRTLSMLDSGHLPLQLTETSLAAEIQELAQLLAPGLTDAGFEVTLQLTSETVFCDTARIRQALLALLDNAQRYANPGPLLISTAREGKRFCLRIEDAGPGIPAELADSIFMAFQRGDDSRSRASGGSGLGLAVVKAIALAHGGTAECGPSHLGGTAFTLSWPVKRRP